MLLHTVRLKRVQRAIQNKRRGMLTRGVCLLHDNGRPHRARVTRELLQTFEWDVLGVTSTVPISHHVIYHLIGKLTEHIAG